MLLIKIARLISVLLILLSIIFTNTSNSVFAQGGDDQKNLQARVHPKTPAYLVLGRQLTKKEIAAYGKNLTKEDIIRQFLPKESKLVIIRAVITIGEAKNATEIVQRLYFPEPKTYEELVSYLQERREKYGSALKGIIAEEQFKEDDGQVFEETALEAYETVFGVLPEELSQEEKQQLFTNLKESDALTLTKIIEVLVRSMTKEDKKEILFGLLDEIGRADLKKNSDFVNKIINQEDLTYKELKGLLEELKQ